MLACRIQWNEKDGYKRNSTVDLEGYIFRRGREAIEVFDKLKTLRESSKEYRLAAMNNMLFSYALADEQKYGRAAAQLLSDWKELPKKDRRSISYRLTELRVESTYVDSVYDLPSRKAYREQLAKLRAETFRLAKEPETDQTEVNSLLEAIAQAYRRFEGD